jgi:SAM-dependent methyltransferase
MSKARPAGDTLVNEASTVYYSGVYWNDLPQVIRYMSECFTGDPDKWWVGDFRDRYCPQPFGRALFINCGNGWVERDFVDNGLAEQAVGFDYSHDLLEQAERQRGDRPITYLQADCNRIELEPDSFDLVVNVAALHHVQHLDRLCRVLCRATRQDGVFVNYDYIGPSRNQYSWWHWLQVRRANRGLPPSIRKPRLRRPHLATMLATDPTEAVHSALIPSVVGRYFDIVERHDTGGGIAYELLTHNPQLGVVPPAERDAQVERLLALDRQATRSGRVPPLFTYFVARPNKAVLRDQARLRGWQEEESERERRAAARGGVYSNAQYLELQLERVAHRILDAARRQR